MEPQHHLVEALESCTCAEDIEYIQYRDVWTGMKAFARTSDVATSIHRILRCKEELALTIRRGSPQAYHNFKRRLLTVMIIYLIEVDSYESPTRSEAQPRRMQATTKAIQRIATKIRVRPSLLRNTRAQGANYNILLSSLGPGSLLGLGSAPTKLWEKELSQQQCRKLIEIRRLDFPKLDQKARQQNENAGLAILLGLRLFGSVPSLDRHRTILSRSLSRHCGPSILDDQWHIPSHQFSVSTPVILPYDSTIFVAIQEAQVSDAVSILRAGPQLGYAVDPYGLSLLYYATYYCVRNRGMTASLNMSRALIWTGVSCFPDDVGNNPLHVLYDAILVEQAARRTEESMLVAQAAELFKCDRNVAWKEYLDSRQLKSAHRALLLGEHRLWDECVEDVDAVDAFHRTPLAWAAEFHWPEAVECLLRRGADVNQTRRTWGGASPLLHLVIAGPARDRMVEVASMLLQHGASVHARDSDGWTAMHIAASWRHPKLMSMLLDYGDVTIRHGILTARGESAQALAENAGGTWSGLLAQIAWNERLMWRDDLPFKSWSWSWTALLPEA